MSKDTVNLTISDGAARAIRLLRRRKALDREAAELLADVTPRLVKGVGIMTGGERGKPDFHLYRFLDMEGEDLWQKVKSFAHGAILDGSEQPAKTSKQPKTKNHEDHK